MRGAYLHSPNTPYCRGAGLKIKRTVSMFLTDFYAVFHTEFLYVFVICLDAKFHMTSFSWTLVIAIKLNIKYRFLVAVMLLFYSLQKI
jgi:hypothetical protein